MPWQLTDYMYCCVMFQCRGCVSAFDYNVSLYKISLLWNWLKFFRQVIRISNNSKSDKNNSIKKCKQGLSSNQLKNWQWIEASCWASTRLVSSNRSLIEGCLIIYYTLCIIHYTLYVIHSTFYIMHYALCIMHYTL